MSQVTRQQRGWRHGLAVGGLCGFFLIAGCEQKVVGVKNTWSAAAPVNRHQSQPQVTRSRIHVQSPGPLERVVGWVAGVGHLLASALAPKPAVDPAVQTPATPGLTPPKE